MTRNPTTDTAVLRKALRLAVAEGRDGIYYLQDEEYNEYIDRATKELGEE